MTTIEKCDNGERRKSMRYTDEYYEESKGFNPVYVYMTLAMSFVVLAVIGLMFLQNGTKSNGSGYMIAKAQATGTLERETAKQEKEINELISGSTLTSDQLDIWTLPSTGREKNTTSDSKNGTVRNKTTGELVAGSESQTTTLLQEETTVHDVAQKEEIVSTEEFTNMTKVSYSDGTDAWLDINFALEQNTYDESKFVYEKPFMKYMVSGKEKSYLGVDISANSGDVNFYRLKNAGCDYVMIRVGSRGYSSGRIVMDEKHQDYLEKAEKAGLDIGVYFYSQAVTEEEIYEEVDAVIEAIKDYDIAYPVVFDMEQVEGDFARTDALDVDTRTLLAKTFLVEIEDAGYKPMLYGDKEWLLTKLNLEELQDYDVWLDQTANTPDYPYQYQMWQYTQKGTVNGVEEPTGLSVSMIDYSEE